ncbi:MAG: ABC transporter permease [Hyphomonadaceae bacterium]|jgi:NitT/TauT family transport system permease protein/taurine transport system permease protein|nr:ABC transporter permease [Hyphomonadaceae bacterium]
MAVMSLMGRLSAGLLLLGILIVWELFSRFIFPHYEASATLILPPPSAGLRDALALLQHGALTEHALASMRRVYVGVAAAAVFAIPLGVVMGLSSLVFRQLGPLLGILRPIPPVAWIPITLLWFGVTDAQQYFIIFIGTFFPMLLNTIAGVHALDPLLQRAALSLGADRPALFEQMLRGALPHICLGVRTSLGLGWFIIVASEMVSASTGLGFLITEARTAMITERLYVGMFAIGLIGFLQDRLLSRLQRRMLPWI